MNNEVKTQQYEDELELIDIWYFIQRQRLLLAIVFLSIATLTFTYAITRPTTWQSRVSLVVGERLFFLQQQQQQQQIEGSDEIKYRYSQNAVITPIKNTRIIEITNTANSKDLAVEQVNKTMNEIIVNHKQIFEDKKIEFVSLLSAISKDNANKTELVRLLDNASNSTLTKQLSDISTEEKPYSGMLLKILGIGSFIGLALAFLLAAIKDYLERKTKPTQQPLST
jgi:capsular polysaccharide biosynthesis protein